MQQGILVAYASNAGSTADVARAIGEELGRAGARVDVRAIGEVSAADLSAYTAVVVGGPMILGWHRDAARFLKSNRPILSRMPVALFATALSLTKTAGGSPADIPVYIDPKLAKPPRNPARPGLKERYATVSRYLGPVLKSAGDIRPASIAFFGGKLDFGRLKFLQMLFVMLIIGAQPGDYRNWDAVRAWARELSGRLSAR